MTECFLGELFLALAGAFLLFCCGAFVGVAAYRNYLDITNAPVHSEAEASR